MINSVCIFGDSVAKGVVLDSSSKKYVILRDSFVNRVQAEKHFAVKNYSHFGSTIVKGQRTLAKHIGELKDFDYVALEYGGNDSDFNWPEVSEAPQDNHLPKTPISLFEQAYLQMVRDVRNAGSRPVILSLPPIDAKRYFAWISRGLNAQNILSWLGDVERIYRWHEMYNVAVMRVAVKAGVPLIDISSAFLETCHYQKLICEDGIHPNEQGHALIARIIEEEVSRNRLLAG
ncbi:SGNH/GDSL hydrolase family protein [Thermocaproicibacter melissae]|uniref:SGNH/GDSL hydrolase family protein n=1 Tax=Thermocaproicibacter melissae TaxID=2966552 RepID=UPI0024B11187|nr:SGNH/GDSL hydrolase family protein [Thermocaproicibacter melissae]WBY64202.1 SGNH/GDSL hydrolase family protein [Thermocaproicibacter melissae]